MFSFSYFCFRKILKKEQTHRKSFKNSLTIWNMRFQIGALDHLLRNL